MVKKNPHQLFAGAMAKARRVLSSKPSPVARFKAQSNVNKLALWYVGYLLDEVRMNEEKNKCQQT